MAGVIKIIIKKLYSDKFWAKNGNIILKNIPELFKFKKTTLVYYPLITGKGLENVRNVFDQTSNEDKELMNYYKSKIDMRHTRWNRILDVQKAVNQRLSYLSDSKNWGKSEYWARAIETHRRCVDDCDGYAVLMTKVLRLFGLSEWEVFTAVGYVCSIDKTRREYHAYCVVFNENNGRFMPLEGSWYPDKSRTEAFANEPIWEENTRYEKPNWLTNDIKSMSKSMLPFKFIK